MKALDIAEMRRLHVGQRAGIYVASKTKHADRWKAMRDEGWPIISTWINEAGPGESADLNDLWCRCIAEASSSKAVVVYREPDDVLKGAFIEIGAALARGVPVLAFGCDEYTVANATGFHKCASIEEAFAHARNFSDDVSMCPRCLSHYPEMHPAVQSEGEIEICPHEFHSLPDRRALASLKGDAQSKAEPSEIEAAVLAEREACEAQARLYASYYSPHSDGRNTFTILADWITSRSNPKGVDAPSSHVEDPQSSTKPAEYSPAPQADPASSCGAVRSKLKPGDPVLVRAVVADNIEARMPTNWPIQIVLDNGASETIDTGGKVHFSAIVEEPCGAAPDAELELERFLRLCEQGKQARRHAGTCPHKPGTFEEAVHIVGWVYEDLRQALIKASPTYARSQGFAAPHMPSMARAIEIVEELLHAAERRVDAEADGSPAFHHWAAKNVAYGQALAALRKANEGAGR